MINDDKGFTTVTIHGPDGSHETIAERTTNPHLVITPGGVTEEGFQGFGFWKITHVPTGRSILPSSYDYDIETIRWMASQLAKADVDWAGSMEDAQPVVFPLLQELIAKADEEEAANTPPDQIPPSTMRKICAANARLLGEQASVQ